MFPPALIHTLTVLSAIAGAARGLYLYLKGRAGWRTLWLVAYCAGLLTLFFLHNIVEVESAAVLFSLLLWLAVTFGLGMWSGRSRRSRSA